MRLRAAALALLLVAATPGALAQANESNRSNSSEGESPLFRGTRDPENRVWWYVSLALVVLALLALLWVLRVIPR